MNLSQMKTALENSVKNVLINSLEKDIEVLVTYNANEGIVEVLLKKEKEIQNNQSSIITYNIFFKEENKELVVLALDRTYIYDKLGIATVINQSVELSDKFITNIKYIISVGIDMIYNPDKYKKSEDSNNKESGTDTVVD